MRKGLLKAAEDGVRRKVGEEMKAVGPGYKVVRWLY